MDRWRDYLDTSNWLRPWFENPVYHFTIPVNGISVFVSEDDFLTAVKAHIGNAGTFKEHAFVYVHGYNMTFSDALYRAAQLTHDMASDGVPFGTAFVFSWPSAGTEQAYPYDIASVNRPPTQEYMRKFIELVQSRSGAKYVHLIAHSMGNFPLLAVLEKMAKENGAEKRFGQIILAAPDVDTPDFIKIGKSIKSLAEGVTLYASSNDRALQFSRKLNNGIPRAGDIPESGPIIVEGLDTIDVSAINTDWLSLRHSAYAEGKELLNDIWRLMRTGERPPNNRNVNLHVRAAGAAQYWQYAY